MSSLINRLLVTPALASGVFLAGAADAGQPAKPLPIHLRPNLVKPSPDFSSKLQGNEPRSLASPVRLVAGQWRPTMPVGFESISPDASEQAELEKEFVKEVMSACDDGVINQAQLSAIGTVNAEQGLEQAKALLEQARKLDTALKLLYLRAEPGFRDIQMDKAKNSFSLDPEITLKKVRELLLKHKDPKTVDA